MPETEIPGFTRYSTFHFTRFSPGLLQGSLQGSYKGFRFPRSASCDSLTFSLYRRTSDFTRIRRQPNLGFYQVFYQVYYQVYYQVFTWYFPRLNTRFFLGFSESLPRINISLHDLQWSKFGILLGVAAGRTWYFTKLLTRYFPRLQ